MSTRDHPDWWRPMGGQNSQDSILERRSLVWNDDGVVAPTIPDTFYEAETYKGKFFTRGCRGMLEQIQVYCIGNGVNFLRLRYSPHPCIGPFAYAQILPAAAWAWQNFNIEEMWNYDSLFIWIYTLEANVDWAYDTVLPYDGHESADAGATWSDMAIRPFIRAVITGETPGDVPVSGILNTISIPNTSIAADTAFGPAFPNAAWTDSIELEGMGELIETHIVFTTAVPPAVGVEYRVRFSADGGGYLDVGNRQITQSVIATFGRCAIGEFLQTATETHLWVRLPIQYRRIIETQAYQSSGVAVAFVHDLHCNQLT